MDSPFKRDAAGSEPRQTHQSYSEVFQLAGSRSLKPVMVDRPHPSEPSYWEVCRRAGLTLNQLDRVQPPASQPSCRKCGFESHSLRNTGDRLTVGHRRDKKWSPMDNLAAPVLVLNNAFEPINICSVKRAMVLVMKGAAIVQETSGKFLRTSKVKLPLPSVVRLLVYRSVPRHTRAVSRKNIMIRDGYTCQYCRSQLPTARLTLDHVIPRSRAGRSTWENLVACCYPCNNRKGDRTPDEARDGAP